MSEQENLITNEPIAEATADVAENTAPEVAPESAAIQDVPTQLNFLDSIAEEYKNSSNISDFKDINDLAKSYVNVQKMVGNSVRIPSEDSSAEMKQEFMEKIKDIPGVMVDNPENRDEIYNKLGRPEAPENYNFTEIVTDEIQAQRPEFMPEVEQFRKQAHELGLSQTQASKLIAVEVAKKQALHEASLKQFEQGDAKLKELWGNDHANRKDNATRVAKIIAEKHPEEMQSLLSSDAGRNPIVAIMLAELAEAYSEKGHTGMQKSSFGTTPEMAEAKLAELKYDKGFQAALYDQLDPSHEEAVKKMTQLYAQAYPEG